MVVLLDVNVLIALIDAQHADHEAAHRWFARDVAREWATCPLTENGAVRNFGNPRYPYSPGSPSRAAGFLGRLLEAPCHSFWLDDISLLDENRFVRPVLGPAARLTDAYLLALAVRRGGQLVTFDRRFSSDAVIGGEAALAVV